MKKFEQVDTHNQLVELDGRYKDYMTKVTNGMRYSIVFYKMYDRRYKIQPYFTVIKTYTLL